MTDTRNERPAPLVPADVDLRDFGFMPLDVRTLLTSSLWIKAKKDPRVAHAAVSLWCECWHQVPAASLPNDDEILAELARCDDKEWKRIREKALLHFVLCSDGRLYHRHVAAKALEAWDQRGGFREAKVNRETRQQRWRERVREACQQLRDRGITPPAGASLETLTRLLESSQPSTDASTGASTSPSTVDKSEIGKTGTGTGTGRNTERGGTPPLLRAPDPEPPAPPAPAPAAPPPASASPGGAACVAMKAAGLPPTELNPSHPDLLRLLQAGVTPETFGATAAEGKAKGKARLAWVLATVEGRLRDAAAKGQAAPPTAASPAGPDPETWSRAPESCQSMAVQLGIDGIRDAEHWPAFQARVIRAWRRNGCPEPTATRETA